LTLCGVCSNLDPNVVRIDEWQGLPGITISHHDSLAVLEQSARDGCDMCRMMHNHILYEDYTVFEDNRLYIYPVKLWRTGLALFVRCNFLEAVIYDFYSSQEDLVKFPMELTYLLRFPSKYSQSNVKSVNLENAVTERSLPIQLWTNRRAKISADYPVDNKLHNGS